MTDPFMPMRNPAPPTPGAGMDRKVARPRGQLWRRARLPALALVLAALAWGAWRLIPAAGSLSVDTADLTIGTVVAAPFQDYLPVRGTVAPLRSIYLDAVEAGSVKTVEVQDGASVQAGQILATLTNFQLQLDVSSREAAITGQLGTTTNDQLTLQQNLAAERTAIAGANYDLLKSRRDLSIRQELNAQSFESDASVKSASDEAQYYGTRLGALRSAYTHDAALAQSQQQQIADTETRLRANLAEVQASLDALVLRAPQSGRLTNFDLQPGQSIHEGDHLGQIDSADAYRLDADIDEFYLGRVAVDQAATAAFADTQATLRVSRVRPQVTAGQFRAELTFVDAPPAGLRRGQTTDLRITLGQTRTAIVVPNGPWLDGSGGTSIFVLSPDGRHATRRTIQTGRRNPEQVEVTAGLSTGEHVVISSEPRYQTYQKLFIH